MLHRITIKCPKCGEITLSDEEYSSQMNNNDGWYCPRCLGFANFGRDLTNCLVDRCTGLIDLEEGEDISLFVKLRKWDIGQ